MSLLGDVPSLNAGSRSRGAGGFELDDSLFGDTPGGNVPAAGKAATSSKKGGGSSSRSGGAATSARRGSLGSDIGGQPGGSDAEDAEEKRRRDLAKLGIKLPEGGGLLLLPACWSCTDLRQRI